MRKSIAIPIVFVLMMWIINVIQFLSNIDFGSLGIQPRHIDSLIGIITAPLIHGNWKHLISNSLPLLILGSILFVSYPKTARKVWILIYMLTGILVWLFARGNSYHIGASGIIYGLASFLFFSGFFRMDIKAIAIASGVAIFYGGMVWGILPLEKGVSWESHLLGGIVGLGLSFLFRNQYRDTLIVEDESVQEKQKNFDAFLEQRSERRVNE